MEQPGIYRYSTAGKLDTLIDSHGGKGGYMFDVAEDGSRMLYHKWEATQGSIFLYELK